MTAGTRPSTFAELFMPKLITVLREGYGVADFKADAVAGLTVAIVALPLSMAIAIASGIAPIAASTPLLSAVFSCRRSAVATDRDVIVYRISGAFFFGAAAAVGVALDRLNEHPKAYVLDVSAVPVLDSTARRPSRASRTKLGGGEWRCTSPVRAPASGERSSHKVCARRWLDFGPASPKP